MGVTIEQWLDLMYGDHRIVDKKIKEEVISKWLIQSYKKQFNEYMHIKKQWMTYEIDADMEHDPPDNALWMYWIRRDDEEVLTDKELSDLEETYMNEEDEIAEIFRIETNIFNFETPMCKTFNEFNCLLKIDTDNNDVPWVPKEPLSENEVPYEIIDHFCVPLCEDDELKNEALMKKAEFEESQDPCSFDVEWRISSMLIT
nr:zf-BED domain-containing protein [Tanacetum cinerariifolium]